MPTNLHAERHLDVVLGGRAGVVNLMLKPGVEVADQLLLGHFPEQRRTGQAAILKPRELLFHDVVEHLLQLLAVVLVGRLRPHLHHKALEHRVDERAELALVGLDDALGLLQHFHTQHVLEHVAKWAAGVALKARGAERALALVAVGDGLRRGLRCRQAVELRQAGGPAAAVELAGSGHAVGCHSIEHRPPNLGVLAVALHRGEVPLGKRERTAVVDVHRRRAAGRRPPGGTDAARRDSEQAVAHRGVQLVGLQAPSGECRCGAHEERRRQVAG